MLLSILAKKTDFVRLLFSHLQIQHVKNQIEYTAIQSRRSLYYAI